VLLTQLLEDVDELSSVHDALDCDNPRREQTEPLRVEAAGHELRKDGEALLRLLVAGQAHREQLERLGSAVLEGDDVRPHFVLDECFDAASAIGGGGSDEEPPVRHHEVGNIGSDLQPRGKAGRGAPVTIELGLGSFGEGRRSYP
jgi:hypothetical protein